jgi:putative transposase
MARLPRLAIPGHLHLVSQHTHAGEAALSDDQDLHGCRISVMEAARQHGVALHAYALLPTQVLLVATPAAANSLSRMWQAVGRRFGADYNRRHGRRGALWEGRFRTAVVEGAAHWLECCRHVEAMPVKMGLCVSPAEYPWSSAAHHVGARVEGGITEPPGYWALGNTPFEREMRYRQALEQPLPEALERRLSEALAKGWAVGSAAFLASLGGLTERRVSPLSRGRPPALGAKKTVPKIG